MQSCIGISNYGNEVFVNETLYSISHFSYNWKDFNY